MTLTEATKRATKEAKRRGIAYRVTEETAFVNGELRVVGFLAVSCYVDEPRAVRTVYADGTVVEYGGPVFVAAMF